RAECGEQRSMSRRPRTPAADPHRKANFREEARGIVAKDRYDRKYGHAVDTAGAIARALERAYKQGFADAQDDHVRPTPEVSDGGPLEWVLIPPRPRNAFWSCCLFMFGRHGDQPRGGYLSRDSLFGQRKSDAFGVQRADGLVDCPVEGANVNKGLMRQMMRLEVAPDDFDVVQLRRIFGQTLDGEPMRAGGQRGQGELAGVDWTVVLDEHHGLDGLAGLGAIEPVQLLEMG